MKIRVIVVGLLIIGLMTGCSSQSASLKAWSDTPLPTLELPVLNTEKAGPLVVSPVKAALGEEIEVQIVDLEPEEMADLGIALLDPNGIQVSTITPVRSSQTLTIPADGQPGAYKVWLAKSTFAANTGINLVVVHVYDDVPSALRDPNPLKVVETYLNAVSQRNYPLAWQALSSDLSTFGRAAWLRGFEATVQSIKIIKLTPQSIPLKETDQRYRCSAELEITTRAQGPSLGAVTRVLRHFSLTKESKGWRIDRISLLP